MKNIYNTQQWIKELIKNKIYEPFTRKDLIKLNLDKPAYFFNIAHRNGWIRRTDILFALKCGGSPTHGCSSNHLP